jgi:hypothetical protein
MGRAPFHASLADSKVIRDLKQMSCSLRKLRRKIYRRSATFVVSLRREDAAFQQDQSDREAELRLMQVFFM